MSGSPLPFRSLFGKLGYMVTPASQTSCLTVERGSWRTQPGRVEMKPEPSLNSSAFGPSVLTSAGITHDAKGNLTTNKNGQTYTWDYENLMKTATSGANTHGYRYDAFRRRVKKTLADGNSVVFAYAGWQVLAEYANGAVPTAPTRTFVYGSYIDEPLMMETGGQKYYYACNALYSVAALTDGAGNVVERYKYEPYGAVTVLNADGSVKTTGFLGNPYTFTGQRLDGETGLMYYKNRYYDVQLGRFVGRDPVFAPLISSQYCYVQNQPTISVDALGLLNCYMVPSGFRYGRYCGPGHPAQLFGPKDLPPIDCLDECCRQHDYCYSHFKVPGWSFPPGSAGQAMCDLALVRCAVECIITKTIRKQACETTHHLGHTYVEILIAIFSTTGKYAEGAGPSFVQPPAIPGIPSLLPGGSPPTRGPTYSGPIATPPGAVGQNQPSLDGSVQSGTQGKGSSK